MSVMPGSKSQTSSTQVNPDWSSVDGKSQILNKPILFSGAYTDLSGKPVLFSGNYADLGGKPSLFDGTYSSLTGKPTTFTPTAHTHVIGDVTGLQTSLNSKLAAPTGTTLQYVRGDGTLGTTPIVPTTLSSFTNDTGYLSSASLPIYRRVDNSVVSAPIKVKYYRVTSDSNSVWTVPLSTDFTEILDVQIQPVSVDNTVVGIRSATLNDYISTSTTVSGVTYGNNVLTTTQVGSGANTLSLSPSTVVRIRVEGK